MTDHTKLRELATHATDGPWEFNGEEVVAPHAALSISELPRLVCSFVGDGDGAFIAAANPANVLELLDEIDARGADIDTHREIVQDQLAEIERLRGLVKWASGQLFDADEVAASDKLMELLDDYNARAPDDGKPDPDGAWPMPLACAFSDACPDGCRGVCQTTIGGAA